MAGDVVGAPLDGSEIAYDGDANLAYIRRHRVGIIGYGSQGRAHALNLRDSGCEVRVGLYEGSRSWPRAEADGFQVHVTNEVARWATLVAIMLPDAVQREIVPTEIEPYLSPGDGLLFAHGFSLRYGLVTPRADVDVLLVAPVGPGHMVRRLFEEGSGVPCVFAVECDISGTAGATALAYSKALGCTRVGAIRTTVEEETETDLFGEQAVLCGGLSQLIKGGYDTLVRAGYQPALAYFECVHQVKLIVDLIYQDGIAGMHDQISDTAKFGDYTAGPRVIDDQVLASMRGVLDDVQDGTFARRWIAEIDAGMPHLRERRLQEERSRMEAIGRQLRRLMRQQRNTRPGTR